MEIDDRLVMFVFNYWVCLGMGRVTLWGSKNGTLIVWFTCNKCLYFIEVLVCIIPFEESYPLLIEG